jgi:GNAT superfamily N-acetyltransferase
LTAAFRVRPYTIADFDGLFELQKACFPWPYPEEQLWTRDQVAAHASVFPQGALCVESAGGRLVASCTSLIIDSAALLSGHTWAEICGNGYLTTHRPDGDILYGIDMAVHPAWRRLGLARLLYQARQEFVVKQGLRAFQAAGRMPGYREVMTNLSPDEYLKDVVKGRRDDPVLTPQLRSGLSPVSLVKDYLNDAESGNCAVLLEWRNPRAARRDDGTFEAGALPPRSPGTDGSST